MPGTCIFAGWESPKDDQTRLGVRPIGIAPWTAAIWRTTLPDPDIKLTNEHSQVNKGNDQQLEALVAIC